MPVVTSASMTCCHAAFQALVEQFVISCMAAPVHWPALRAMASLSARITGFIHAIEAADSLARALFLSETEQEAAEAERMMRARAAAAVRISAAASRPGLLSPVRVRFTLLMCCCEEGFVFFVCSRAFARTLGPGAPL